MVTAASALIARRWYCGSGPRSSPGLPQQGLPSPSGPSRSRDGMRRLLELVELGDVVDILLVTVLVYTAVVWIRRTQAAFVAIGLFLLAVLYVLAEAFDLQLTTAIFRGFFAISVVIIVVLFQEELRQLFERLGVWSVRRGRRAGPPRSLPADILVETLSDLARQHIGALIVVPGRQPVVRHVRG